MDYKTRTKRTMVLKRASQHSLRGTTEEKLVKLYRMSLSVAVISWEPLLG